LVGSLVVHTRYAILVRMDEQHLWQDMERQLEAEENGIRRRVSRFDLSQSAALWNRNHRGEIEAWREIYRLASGPSDEAAALRRRILHLCQTVPLSFPHLFIAAMRSLGERVDPYPSVPPPVGDIA
jgi:hypothetical protein